MASLQQINALLDEKMKPIEEAVDDLKIQLGSLNPSKPDHLPDVSDVKWRSDGARQQYVAWTTSWVNYCELENKMAAIPDSNSKVSVLVSLTEGKTHVELLMREVLMGDTYGWDFVKEYKSPSLALGSQDEDKIKKTEKVIMARRKARSTEGNMF